MKRPKRITCSFCGETVSKKWLQRHWLSCPNSPAVGSTHHICSVCQICKLLERFSTSDHNPGGLMHTCKDCAVIQRSHWKRLNRDRKTPSFGEVKLRPGAWRLRPCRYCGRLFNFRGMHAHVATCDGSGHQPRRPEDPFLPDMERVLNEHLMKDRKAEIRARALWRQYGITVADYDRMFAEQGGKCAICGNPPRGVRNNPNPIFMVDHCHSSTGADSVRGLLCDQCNHGIGQFRDNPAFLYKAIEYLVKHRPVPEVS